MNMAPEEVFAGTALVKVQGGAMRQVRALFLRSVPGLAATEATWIPGSWVITHLASGAFLGPEDDEHAMVACRAAALSTLWRLGPLLDWTQDEPAVVAQARSLGIRTRDFLTSPGWCLRSQVRPRVLNYSESC